jgi:hypothetical protein
MTAGSPSEINMRAPVIGGTEIEIAASPEAVSIDAGLTPGTCPGSRGLPSSLARLADPGSRPLRAPARLATRLIDGCRLQRRPSILEGMEHLRDPSDSWSLGVIEAETKNDVRSLAAADPAVDAGVATVAVCSIPERP